MPSLLSSHPLCVAYDDDAAREAAMVAAILAESQKLQIETKRTKDRVGCWKKGKECEEFSSNSNNLNRVCPTIFLSPLARFSLFGEDQKACLAMKQSVGDGALSKGDG